MTNAERRAALNLARRMCLHHANEAEAAPVMDGISRQGHGEMAKVWASVAEAMKVDSALEADGPDGRPEGIINGLEVTR